MRSTSESKSITPNPLRQAFNEVFNPPSQTDNYEDEVPDIDTMSKTELKEEILRLRAPKIEQSTSGYKLTIKNDCKHGSWKDCIRAREAANASFIGKL